MLGVYRASASGLLANQLGMDVIANNLANVQTPGFQGSRVSFQDLVYRNASLVGDLSGFNQAAPQSVLLGAGVQSNATDRDLNQGNVLIDNNPYHYAINGDGYFVVQLPDGTAAYTRNGSFQVDANGRLSTSDGDYLLPNVAIPPDAHNIATTTDGRIYAEMDGTGKTYQIGTLQIARFPNSSGLISIGHNLLRATPESGAAAMNVPGEGGAGQIVGGALEASNVDVSSQMSNMIIAERAYQLNVKALQTIDQMVSGANNIGR